MKNSNQNLMKEHLTRNEMKNIIGGGSNICANGRTIHFDWSCPDGSASGSGVTCAEFLQAYNDMLNDFCGV